MPLSLTSSSTFNPTALLDSMTSVFNPYPIILQSIRDQTKRLANPHILTFAATLIITHFILLLQAAITFSLKIFRKNKGDEGFFWLWRKKYTSDQELPYFVPNGTLFCELLQLIGCLCFEWFAITTYITCSNPHLISATLRSIGFFWLSVSFVPGFIGFWLSGWSAIYVVFFSPTRLDIKHMTRTIQHPLVMNSICIGIPLLVALFFSSIGIVFSFKHRKLFDSYITLIATLDQSSALWKANASQNLHNNRELLRIMDNIKIIGGELCQVSKLMAFGWAAVSLFISIFYLATTFTLGKSMKLVMLQTIGKRSIHDKEDKWADSGVNSRDALNESVRTDHSNSSTSDMLKARFNQPRFAVSLQRSYYFVYLSCGIITLALVFNFASSMILGMKAKVFLVETHWQERIFALVTCMSVLLSVSLFLQSLLLVWN